jgi:hypothetical protein
LSLDQSGNGLLISWPDFVQGYTLQSTPTLSPLNWVDLVTAFNRLSFQPTNAMQFFRLIKSGTASQ